MMKWLVGSLLALVSITLASPIDNNNVLARGLPPAVCAEVNVVVDVLKLYKATPFCSSFLSITTQTSTITKTSTSVVLSTSTSTSLAQTTNVILSTTTASAIAQTTSTSISTSTSTIIAPTSTVFITATATTTTTVPGSTVYGSTSLTFLSGNPPSPTKLRRDSLEDTLEERHAVNIPSYLAAFASSAISSGCQCLNIATPTTTATTTASAVSTSVVLASTTSTMSVAVTNIISTTTTTTVQNVVTSISVTQSTSTPITTSTSTTVTTVTETADVTISTYYPCVSPFIEQAADLPYGDPTSPNINNLGLQSSLYALGQPEGMSALACCNACYFGLANCVQAYWSSYEGCIVSTATDLSSASGSDISSSCPAGTFNGLTYIPDMLPVHFLSTGNMAGPCGQVYNNV